MADHRFDGAHGDIVRPWPKTEADCLTFRLVVEDRGGAVQRYVAHLILGQPGIFNRPRHRPGRLLPVRVQPHHVVSIAGGGVAENLSVDRRAPFKRPLPLLED